MKPVFKGLLNAQHNITFYIFEKSPGRASTTPAWTQCPDMPSAATGHPSGAPKSHSLRGISAPSVVTSFSPNISSSSLWGAGVGGQKAPTQTQENEEPSATSAKLGSFTGNSAPAVCSSWPPSEAGDTAWRLSSWGQGSRGDFRRDLLLFLQSGAVVIIALAAQGSWLFAALCPGAPHRALPRLACRPPGSVS